MYNIAIWKVFIEIYYMATVAHAFLKRQAGIAGPLQSTGPDVLSWPDEISSPTGTQRLSWTGGAPWRTGEGEGLSPTLLTVPHSSACLSLASSPGPAPSASPRARQFCLSSCWGPHHTPPLLQPHLPEGAEAHAGPALARAAQLRLEP